MAIHKTVKRKCPKCNEIYSINYNLLYHDPINKFMIYRFVERNEKKINAFLEDCTYFNDNILNNYNLRIVYSENELIEKINIFKENLNDIYIEIIKKITSLRFTETESNNLSGFFFQETQGEQFIFELLYNNGKQKFISVPTIVYERLENKLINSPNAFIEVNTENAFSYLQSEGFFF